MFSKRKRCPLCYSTNFERDYYKVPFKKIGKFNVAGYEVAYYPYIEAELFKYSKCNKCESLFVDPVDLTYWQPSDKPQDDTKVKHAKEKWNWPTYQAIVDNIEKHVKQHDILMDMACGSGQCLLVLKEKGINYKQAIGVDVGKEYIKFVRDSGFKGIIGDIMEVDLSAYYGRVDAIIFHEAMEHVLEPKACVDHFHKLLASGGVLYFTVQAVDKNCPLKKGENMFATEYAINDMFKDYKKLELTRLPDRWQGVYRKI